MLIEIFSERKELSLKILVVLNVGAGRSGGILKEPFLTALFLMLPYTTNTELISPNFPSYAFFPLFLPCSFIRARKLNYFSPLIDKNGVLRNDVRNKMNLLSAYDGKWFQVLCK